MIRISVVMPAYNVEKYIAQAIESVMAQTFSDWELIIVDDASSDNTLSIAHSYQEKDSRIKVYTSDKNAGSPGQVRRKAISMAEGEWILALDSDDYLDCDTLEKLYNRAQETKADIVLLRLVTVSEEGLIINDPIPAQDFDMSSVLSGGEACMLTIGEWIINGNGLIKRKMYQPVLNGEICLDYIYSDEYITRFIFVNSEFIALCDTNYYYRANPSSVSRAFNVRLFEVIEVDNLLEKLVCDKFGEYSSEFTKVSNSMVEHIRELHSLYLKNKSKLTKQERIFLKKRLKKAYKEIKRERCACNSRIKSALLFKNYYLFYVTNYILLKMRR